MSMSIQSWIWTAILIISLPIFILQTQTGLQIIRLYGNTRQIIGEYNPNAPKGQDGRWRWAIRDTDFGFGLAYGGQVNHDTLSYASTEGRGFGAPPAWSVFLFKTLLENDDFRNKFINRFADHINTAFVPERVNEMIDKKSGDIAHIIDEHNRRWNKIEDWNKEVNILRDFANRRPSYRYKSYS